LRDAIDASELSRYRICKEIGLGESTMSHFMAGQCGLQLSTIDRLCELLDLRLVIVKRPSKGEGR
jgi:DNA-binding Xre family transcriptional regulator